MEDFKKNPLWNTIFFFTIFLLELRIFVSFLNQKNLYRPILGVICLALVVVTLVLLEGLQVAITGLKSVAYGDLEDALSTQDHYEHKSKILLLHKEIQENFHVFVTGIQVSIIFLLFVFDEIFPFFKFSNTNTFILSLDRFRPELGIFAKEILTGHVADYFVTVFFLCWLTQLGPGFLADKSSLAFLKPRLSKYVLLYTVKFIGNSGIGAPGHKVHRALRAFSLFRIDDNIQTGRATVFAFEASNFGFSIRTRDIHLSISQTETLVTEETVYIFKRNTIFPNSPKTRTLQHAIMLDEEKLSGDVIDSFDSEIATPSHLIVTSSSILSRNQFKYDTEEMKNSLPSREVIVYLVISFEDPLPREAYDEEQITITTVSKLQSMNLDSRASDFFSFEVAKPTEKIKFTITKPDASIFLTEPSVLILGMDELYNQDIITVFERPKCHFEKNSRDGVSELRGELSYPLLSSRVVLGINAQRPHRN